MRVGKVNDGSQVLGNQLVRCKFRAIVCSDGLYMFPVGQQQPAYLPGQRPGLFPVRQLRHEEHVGGTLHDSEDSVAVGVYNQVHLEIPEPFSICLFGALVDTGPAGFLIQ